MDLGEDMQNHLIMRHPAPMQTMPSLRPLAAVLLKLGDSVMPGQFSKWEKWWSVFMVAINISVGQKANFLMEVVSDGTASQVLVEFPDGIGGVTFKTLLTMVSCQKQRPSNTTPPMRCVNNGASHHNTS